MSTPGGQARFVAFEGGEGCGKSTQARLLAERLSATFTFEPGATSVGAAIRALALDPATEGLDHRAETLLMIADRAQHVAEVVRPALDAGRHVVTDRYAGSSVAYQGYGRGLDPARVEELSAWATGGLWPDLVVVLDVEPVRAADRLGRDLDRFEREDGGFHERVRQGFVEQARQHPDTWVTLDGSGSVEEVADLVRAAVRDRLQLAV